MQLHKDSDSIVSYIHYYGRLDSVSRRDPECSHMTISDFLLKCVAKRTPQILDQKKFDAAFDFSFCEISLDLAKCNKKSDLLGKFCVLN